MAKDHYQKTFGTSWETFLLSNLTLSRLAAEAAFTTFNLLHAGKAGVFVFKHVTESADYSLGLS